MIARLLIISYYAAIELPFLTLLFVFSYAAYK